MMDAVQFATELEAQDALADAGFSLGTLQRDSPRGVMFGDWDIAKWRNLRADERRALHAVYQRKWRDGPVTISFSDGCPAEPRAALTKAAETARTA